MVRQRRPDAIVFGYLADGAEVVLAGPLCVSVGDTFWGEPNLALRCEAAPLVHGVALSRAAYANLCDGEQSTAILREASWDAQGAWLSVKGDVRAGREPAAQYPIVSVRYASVDVSWLRNALASLAGLRVPVDVAYDELSDRRYTLGVYRLDRSSIRVCWGAKLEGDFEALRGRWEAIWRETGDLLDRGTPVAPEESWPFGAVPVYKANPLFPGRPEDAGGARAGS